MSNLNVSLTDELVSYVKTKVESGRYASSSEVVRRPCVSWKSTIRPMARGCASFNRLGRTA